VVELFLRRRRAGSNEVNVAELFRRVVTVLMTLLGRSNADRSQEESRGEKNVLQKFLSGGYGGRLE
jgi:hypothetical protein